MNFYNGMKVVEASNIQEVARVQLPDDFDDCSPKCKQRINNWLREKFGTYLPTYIIGGHTIVMHPTHVAMLKALNKLK